MEHREDGTGGAHQYWTAATGNGLLPPVDLTTCFDTGDDRVDAGCCAAFAAMGCTIWFDQRHEAGGPAGIGQHEELHRNHWFPK